MENVKVGRIVRWVHEKGWGLINSYQSTDAPEKFFVHFSNCIEPDAMEVGVRVTFVPGPPRTARELPIATNVAVYVKTHDLIADLLAGKNGDGGAV